MTQRFYRMDGFPAVKDSRPLFYAPLGNLYYAPGISADSFLGQWKLPGAGDRF